jgi:hypothetical protein
MDLCLASGRYKQIQFSFLSHRIQGYAKVVDSKCYTAVDALARSASSNPPLPTALIKRVNLCSAGPPWLARPPRPGACLDFGFQYAQTTGQKIRVEYWALSGLNSPWRPCSGSLHGQTFFFYYLSVVTGAPS